MIGFFCFSFWHRLAEGDRGGFEKAATVVAVGCFLSCFIRSWILSRSYLFLQLKQETKMAVHEAESPFLGISGLEMETVIFWVMTQSSLPVSPGRNSEMRLIWSGFFYRLIHFVAICQYFSGGLAGKEILKVEILWIVSVPDSTRTAEIRDS